MAATTLSSISIVLNVHREADCIARTLKSLDAAVAVAKEKGHAVEVVAVFDRSDQATLDAFSNFELSAADCVRRIAVDHGNLALSRNSGVEAASGDYVMVADADDLMSTNTLAAKADALSKHGPDTLAIPEFCVAFGAWRQFRRYRPLAGISKLSFVNMHPFVSSVMARRAVFVAIPYVATFPKTPFHYEDWRFNCECVANGIDIVVAPGTIAYYRQRVGSIMSRFPNAPHRHLAATSLFSPPRFTAIAAADYQSWRSGDAGRRLRHRWSKAAVEPLADDIVFQNRIDPEIRLDCTAESQFADVQRNTKLHIGAAYFELCTIIGAFEYNHVFILPSRDDEEAEDFVKATIASLYRNNPTARTLVLGGQTDSSAPDSAWVAPNCTVLDLARDWPLLNDDERVLVLFRLIQSIAANALIHVPLSSFGIRFLTACQRSLPADKLILYPFHAAGRLDDERMPRHPRSSDLTRRAVQPDDPLGPREQISFLEEQNSALQDALAFERARLSANYGAQAAGHPLSMTPEEIRFDGRALPLKAFWGLAKVWRKPWKRRVAETLLRMLGAKT